MSAQSYIPVDQGHIDALKNFIRTEFHVARFKENEEISPNINWRPTIQIKINKHTTYAFEINERVCPPILIYTRSEIVNTHQPICVFSVCPEESYTKNQPEFRKLQEYGFGLITIDNNGHMQLHHKAIPLAQFIPKEKYNELVKAIPSTIKQRIKTAFDEYNHSPVGGLRELTSLIEGLTFHVAAKIVAKGHMNAHAANIHLADLLAEMTNVASTQRSPLRGQLAAISGFQSHVKAFRNPAHHEPKTAKHAKELLASTSDGFTEGIRKISDFITAFKNYGITIRL